MSTNPKQQGCKITLYWLTESGAQRIAFLLEELNLVYELKVYKRLEMRAPEELKKIHPLGKSPTLEVQPLGAEKPIVLAESGRIIEYLVEHFGSSLIPKRYLEGHEGGVGSETEEWMRYRYLMHYSAGSLMSVNVVSIIVDNISLAPVPFFLKPITRLIGGKINEVFTNPELTAHMDFLEDYLSKSPNGGEFFCGQAPSAADWQIMFPLEVALRRGVPFNEANYPRLYSWVRRMQSRESHQRAAEKVSKATGQPFVPFSDLKKM